MRKASTPHSPAREELIERLGAEDPAGAVRLVQGTPDTGAHPRERSALLAFLNGGTVREVSAHLGVSEVRTLQLIRRAARDVVRVRKADTASRTRLEGLSNRSRRSLDRAGLDTDDKVRRLVELYGAKALRSLELFGVHQHEEVCAAFGFDPEEPVRLDEGIVRRLKSFPTHLRRLQIRDLILSDERVHMGDPGPPLTADHKEADPPDDLNLFSGPTGHYS